MLWARALGESIATKEIKSKVVIHGKSKGNCPETGNCQVFIFVKKSSVSCDNERLPFVIQFFCSEIPLCSGSCVHV